MRGRLLRDWHLDDVCKSPVHRGAVHLNHFLPLLAVGFDDLSLNGADRFILREDPEITKKAVCMIMLILEPRPNSSARDIASMM